MPGDFAYHQRVASHSSVDSTLAAAGIMIGNIAKGLMEGAGPRLNNMMAMALQKVVKYVSLIYL